MKLYTLIKTEDPKNHILSNGMSPLRLNDILIKYIVHQKLNKKWGVKFFVRRIKHFNIKWYTVKGQRLAKQVLYQVREDYIDIIARIV